MINNLYLILGLSLTLGMLVGIQREHVNSQVAGIRTFPLITLTGTLCALLAQELGGWLVAAGIISVAALLVITNWQRTKVRQRVGGLTTEMSIILMFLIGAYLVYGSQLLAVVLTGVIVVLLHFKPALHGFVDKIGEKDLKAVMQFVLITLVILPVLPNENFGPYGVINPREIWWMVVLIVGISLVGYFLYKLLGGNLGVLAGGLLGGLVSSTATTVSYARKSSGAANITHVAVLVLLAATVVSYARVLIEIAVVAPGIFGQLLWPIAMELGLFALMTLVWFFRQDKEKQELPEQHNPAEIKNALIFAALYGLIVFVSAWVQNEIGQGGLFGVAVLSGLTNMDAITLSTAGMAADGKIDTGAAWKLILTASLANLAFKGGIVMFLGSRALKKYTFILFGTGILVGIGILLFW